MEVWKIIDKAPNYEVSDLDNIRNIKTLKFLKGVPNQKGYLRVNLYIDKKLTTVLIHRIVAEAFIENVENLPQVNHLNEDKSDNTANNLEWCTNLQNRRHGTVIERIAKSNSISILQYSLDGILIKEWQSANLASKALNLSSSSHIYECCKGGFYRKGLWVNVNSAHGFVWKYNDKK